jgi:hypothetical protein
MSVTLDWTNAPFVRCGKHFNQFLMVATLVMQTKLWWLLWWGVADSILVCGSMESGDRFFVGTFDEYLTSMHVKIFSHLI